MAAGFPLTRDEHVAILRLLADGMTKADIARQLGLNRCTVIDYAGRELDDPEVPYSRQASARPLGNDGARLEGAGESAGGCRTGASLGGTVFTASLSGDVSVGGLGPILAELAREQGPMVVTSGDEGVAAATDVASRAAETVAPAPDNLEAVLSQLRKTPLTIEEIASRGKVSVDTAAAWVIDQQARGVNLRQFGNRFSIARQSPQGNADGKIHEYVSRPDNTFVFGACGDQHIGSKYFRQDVLDDLYDEFAKAGVDRVFNGGNWIDGEAPFNMFDLTVHGLDGQLQALVDCYPQRDGIHTYAISGNDHEGWYNKKLGVEVGIYAERAMINAGRSDWHHLGFMQANVRLVNANTGKACTLTVMHPGGGSAYAVSYKPQKIVEGFSGGEKPAVLLIAHYHKLSVNLIRNVWAVQVGCQQDQTPFMMQKLIEPHVGGVIVKVEQDPETGAIIRCVPDIRNYFVREYYNGRWSMSHDAVLPRRAGGAR